MIEQTDLVQFEAQWDDLYARCKRAEARVAELEALCQWAQVELALLPGSSDDLRKALRTALESNRD